jgi:arginyl-tRNA synthetase
MTEGSPVSVATEVADAVRAAVGAVAPDAGDVDPLVRPSDFADLQANVALPLGKRLGRPPRELAQEIAARIADDANRDGPAGRVVAEVTVSGPGFLNVTVADRALWRRVAERVGDERLGVGWPRAGERTVIDYSAPNIAKEMHVGHLRTTIIGDCLARVLGHLGADVVRHNHIGDWGTQFGMLIQFLDEHPDRPWHARDLGSDDGVSALDELYREARAAFDADPAFADRSRARVVALQSGDDETMRVWRDVVAESERSFDALYRRLGVLLTIDDVVGESFYNPWLADVVRELTEAGIAVESEGALCVFDPEVTGPDGEPVPLIVRKSDGGYGYDATDLATLRHRVRDLKARRVLYVVDARQALHFRLVFAAGRRAGWVGDDVELRHVAFGTVLGPDGRPFRTRAGGTVRLGELLDDAVARARAVIAERHEARAGTATGPIPLLSTAELDDRAHVVGIGAVKYADLSTSRTKDYTFDVERMVAFTGDTGAYLQYAHARVRSILRRADPGLTGEPAVAEGVVPEPEERALALRLDGFGDCLAEVAAVLEPHRLCNHLYALARAFTDFYESCPVLGADTPAQRGNRLTLCRLTAATLRQGLELLGLTAPERL